MSDFARQIYADMKPVDRVLLFMVKVEELFDLQKAMDARDIKLIKHLLGEEDAHAH